MNVFLCVHGKACCICYLMQTTQGPPGPRYKLREGETEDVSLCNDASQCWAQDRVLSSNGDTARRRIKSRLSLEESFGRHHIPLMACLWKRPWGRQHNEKKKDRKNGSNVYCIIISGSRSLLLPCSRLYPASAVAQLVPCHPADGRAVPITLHLTLASQLDSTERLRCSAQGPRSMHRPKQCSSMWVISCLCMCSVESGVF